jgi:large subunit ribosomal protein L18
VVKVSKVSKVSSPRKRRVRRTRRKIAELNQIRLTVYKTPRHIYAQVFTADGSQVLASASSVDKEIRSKVFNEGGKVKVAEAVGALVAERAKLKGVSKVAFDRSGFKYHGRIKALADQVRAAGLEF